jgi:hypothetical protein
MTKKEQALNLKKASIYAIILASLYVLASLYMEHKKIEVLNEIGKISGNDIPYLLNTSYIIMASIPSFLSCVFLYICGMKLQRQTGILNELYNKFGRRKFMPIVFSVLLLGFLTTVSLVVAK